MREYASLDDAWASTGDPRRELPFRCHVHDDHSASASLNRITGFWVCYACKAKGKADGTLVKTEEQDMLDLLMIMAEFDTKTEMPEAMLALYTGNTEYWQTRFSPETCRHFQLGAEPDTGRPTYPIREASGKLVGVCRRSVDGLGPKYKYPSGIKVTDMLFNFSTDQRDTVYLFEGAPNVMAAWEVGIEGFGIYGSKLSRQQINLIHKVGAQRIVLCFDNDNAGRQATHAVFSNHELRQYELRAFPWHHSDVCDYSDVAEIFAELRKAKLESLRYETERG